MIPKVIHYCWFGRGKKPPLAEKCIASWRKFLPDYEIKEWNEGNYDVNAIPYTAEAYAVKKYAFVSDYARFDILYREGGVYFDTDVEVIKPMDDILAAGPYMGIESFFKVASGLGLAAMPQMPLYDAILKEYSMRHFMNADGAQDQSTVVEFVTQIMLQRGLKPALGIVPFESINIYPAEYFNPKELYTGRVRISENTRTIHHYSASWKTGREQVVLWAIRRFGVTFGKMLSLILHRPGYIVNRVLRYSRTRT